MRTNGVGYSCMLQRDGGAYYFRKAIPEALRPFFPSKKDGSKGQRELLVSLRTKDKEVAKSRLHRAALEADAKLAAAKRKLATQTPQVLADRWKAARADTAHGVTKPDPCRGPPHRPGRSVAEALALRSLATLGRSSGKQKAPKIAMISGISSWLRGPAMTEIEPVDLGREPRLNICSPYSLSSG